MPLKTDPSFVCYQRIATIIAREPALAKAGGETEMVQKPNGTLAPFPSLVIRTTNTLHEAGRDIRHMGTQDIIQQAAVLAKIVPQGSEKSEPKPKASDGQAKPKPKAKGAVAAQVLAATPRVRPRGKAASPQPKTEVDTAPGPATQRLEKRPTDVAIAVFALLANAYELIERHDKTPGVVEEALKPLEKVSQRYKKLSQVVPGAA